MSAIIQNSQPQLIHRINPIATFAPLPWQIAPWRDKSPVMLLTGSAGGGKSRLAAEKLHAFCKKYPGATGVALRKNRSIMTNSTVLFLEREVIGDDPSVVHVPSKFRFEYSNRSILCYAGMHDKKEREHFRSIGQKGGVDIAWMEEANQFDEPDFDEVTTRMRGRAADWRQLLLTTNPDSPLHFIYRLLILGKRASVHFSQAAYNTYNPDDYQSTLDQLRGTMRKRMRDGEWVMGSGLVYEDEWRDEEGSPDSNVTKEAEYEPGAGPVYWGVDDGYAGEVDDEIGYFKPMSHPRVFHLCQMRSNGDLCVFDESYRIKLLDREHLKEVMEMRPEGSSEPYPLPEFAAVDKSASTLKKEIWMAGIPFRNGAPTVDESIKEMRRWIAPNEQGHRRLKVHPRCKKLRLEMVSCRLDPDTGKPVKDYDHGPDDLRYLIWNFRHDQG